MRRERSTQRHAPQGGASELSLPLSPEATLMRARSCYLAGETEGLVRELGKAIHRLEPREGAEIPNCNSSKLRGLLLAYQAVTILQASAPPTCSAMKRLARVDSCFGESLSALGRPEVEPNAQSKEALRAEILMLRGHCKLIVGTPAQAAHDLMIARELFESAGPALSPLENFLRFRTKILSASAELLMLGYDHAKRMVAELKSTLPQDAPHSLRTDLKIIELEVARSIGCFLHGCLLPEDAARSLATMPPADRASFTLAWNLAQKKAFQLDPCVEGARSRRTSALNLLAKERNSLDLSRMPEAVAAAEILMAEAAWHMLEADLNADENADKRRQLEQNIEALEEAIGILEERVSGTHYLIANGALSLSALHRGGGDRIAAHAWAECAVRVARSAFGENHRITKAALNRIEPKPFDQRSA